MQDFSRLWAMKSEVITESPLTIKNPWLYLFRGLSDQIDGALVYFTIETNE